MIDDDVAGQRPWLSWSRLFDLVSSSTGKNTAGDFERVIDVFYRHVQFCLGATRNTAYNQRFVSNHDIHDIDKVNNIMEVVEDIAWSVIVTPFFPGRKRERGDPVDLVPAFTGVIAAAGTWPVRNAVLLDRVSQLFEMIDCLDRDIMAMKVTRIDTAMDGNPPVDLNAWERNVDMVVHLLDAIEFYRDRFEESREREDRDGVVAGKSG